MNGLNTLAANAEKLKQQGEVAFGEIVSSDFLKSHTDFESLDDLFSQAGFVIKTKEDFEAVPQDEIDAFIKEKTKFTSFSDLQSQAVAEFVQKQLLNGLK
nr:hypothetical protein [Acinetobacter pittii]